MKYETTAEQQNTDTVVPPKQTRVKTVKHETTTKQQIQDMTEKKKSGFYYYTDTVLKKEVGDVVDGLTEMADKFPEDFSDLVKTLKTGHDKSSSKSVRNKDDIADLAALINQVRISVPIIPWCQAYKIE